MSIAIPISTSDGAQGGGPSLAPGHPFREPRGVVQDRGLGSASRPRRPHEGPAGSPRSSGCISLSSGRSCRVRSGCVCRRQARRGRCRRRWGSSASAVQVPLVSIHPEVTHGRACPRGASGFPCSRSAAPVPPGDAGVGACVCLWGPGKKHGGILGPCVIFEGGGHFGSERRGGGASQE